MRYWILTGDDACLPDVPARDLPRTAPDLPYNGRRITRPGPGETWAEYEPRSAHPRQPIFLSPCSAVERLRGTPYRREGDGPTPDWRATATAIWATLPPTDSEIFGRKPENEAPRHGALAEQLKPTLKWARMLRHSGEPLSTNYLQPDRDTYGPDDDDRLAPSLNAGWRYGDSPDTLAAIAAKAADTQWRHAKFGGGGAVEQTIGGTLFPARAGKLRFANGETDTEWVHVRKDDDKVVLNRVTLRAGSMMYQQDERGELLGPEPDKDEIAVSNSYFRRMVAHFPGSLGSTEVPPLTCRVMAPVRFIKAGRIRRKEIISQTEQIKALATMPHPPITHCLPGIACGTPHVGQQFLGGRITKTKGASGSERWEDKAAEMVRQEEFAAWHAALPPEQQRALNIAATARSFKQIGESFGKSGKVAEREGKAILLAANDNLAVAQAAAA